jgi:hypothetical protein
MNYKPSNIICYGSYCEVALRNRQGKEIAKAVVDTEDVYKVAQVSWSLRPDGYAFNYTFGRMHHLIVGKPKAPLQIDHINRNPLDNRKVNLRIVSRSINQINRNRQVNNKSGIKNLCFDKARNRWLVQIQRKGEKKIFKRFKTKEEALSVLPQHL